MKTDSRTHEPRSAPYGTWKSPITAGLVTSQVIGLSSVQIRSDDLYWLEQRPSENGRSVIVRSSLGARSDVIPNGFNARSRVHEYGGGSFYAAEDIVFFSNFADNGLYSITQGGEPRLVAPLANCRYADFSLDQARKSLYCVREDHTQSVIEPENCLVAIRLDNGSVHTLVAGDDFYASPTLSADGAWLAWLSWNHPNMPWDGTELWKAPILNDGSLGPKTLVAGSAKESLFQPQWGPDGTLYYVSDRNGWWNIYRDVNGTAEEIWVKDAEFGEPQWVFGQSTYGFSSNNTIICSYTHDGDWHLAAVDLQTGKATVIETPYTAISYVRCTDRRCCFIGSSAGELPAVVELDLSDGKYDVVQRGSSVDVPSKYLSVAQPIQFTTSDGLIAYANYYAPKNDDFVAPDNELPPLLVGCHGGPTSTSSCQLNLTVQYWTSRGFAFVQVNYGGSTGYGREYHERLNGNWGIVDVEDCVNCALNLSDSGVVDGNRMTIHGGSAGGYTALCALTFHRVFAAGASFYGVSDLEALAKDTHKFESHYLDRLIGPYPAAIDTYIERSPVHFADSLAVPVIFFQGIEDKVVPPDQAVMMVDALKTRKIPVAYIAFEGEGHGFRKSESIKRCLEAHIYFYAWVFGIKLADQVEPVTIVGMG